MCHKTKEELEREQGEAIIKFLCLKTNNGIIDTTYGRKNAIGVARSIKNILNSNKPLSIV